MTDRDWNELRNEFHQTTDAMIKRSGRSIIAVFDCEGDDQPFAYTIGNHLTHVQCDTASPDLASCSPSSVADSYRQHREPLW